MKKPSSRNFSSNILISHRHIVEPSGAGNSNAIDIDNDRIDRIDDPAWFCIGRSVAKPFEKQVMGKIAHEKWRQIESGFLVHDGRQSTDAQGSLELAIILGEFFCILNDFRQFASEDIAPESVRKLDGIRHFANTKGTPMLPEIH